MKFEKITHYLNNELWNIKEVVEDNNIIRFVKVNDYTTGSDRLVIFDIKTGNILYNIFNSFSSFTEVYAVYDAIDNFLINMKEIDKKDIFEYLNL